MKKLLWGTIILCGLTAIPLLLGYGLTIGGFVLDQAELEKLHERGYRRPRIVIGGCVIARDINLRMLSEVIPTLYVVGGLVGPKALKDAYGDGLKVIGGADLSDPNRSSETTP